MTNQPENTLTGKQLRHIFDSFDNPRNRTLKILRRKIESLCGISDSTIRNYTHGITTMPKLVSEKIQEILKNNFPELIEVINNKEVA